MAYICASQVKPRPLLSSTGWMEAAPKQGRYMEESSPFASLSPYLQHSPRQRPSTVASFPHSHLTNPPGQSGLERGLIYEGGVLGPCVTQSNPNHLQPPPMSPSFTQLFEFFTLFKIWLPRGHDPLSLSLLHTLEQTSGTFVAALAGLLRPCYLILFL